MRGRFYHLLIAHQSAGNWPSYSPGRLLREYLIEWSARGGLQAFDFGFGDEPYKAAYERHPLFEAMLPATLRGRAYRSAVDMRRIAVAKLRQTTLAAQAKRIL